MDGAHDCARVLRDCWVISRTYMLETAAISLSFSTSFVWDYFDGKGHVRQKVRLLKGRLFVVQWVAQRNLPLTGGEAGFASECANSTSRISSPNSTPHGPKTMSCRNDIPNKHCFDIDLVWLAGSGRGIVPVPTAKYAAGEGIASCHPSYRITLAGNPKPDQPHTII